MEFSVRDSISTRASFAKAADAIEFAAKLHRSGRAWVAIYSQYGSCCAIQFYN